MPVLMIRCRVTGDGAAAVVEAQRPAAAEGAL